jgi:cell fate regulator YaaT (PSP1 superfamily)
MDDKDRNAHRDPHRETHRRPHWHTRPDAGGQGGPSRDPGRDAGRDSDAIHRGPQEQPSTGASGDEHKHDHVEASGSLGARPDSGPAGGADWDASRVEPDTPPAAAEKDSPQDESQQERQGGPTEVIRPGRIPKIVQVEFKGERTDYFANPKQLPITVDDRVVVQVERGRDMGRVVRTGEILEKITKVRQVAQEVLRRATDEDTTKYEENIHKEEEARKVCEEKIAERELKMKLVDVEYQLDSSKITFFFTADERVDFRELVKDLAGIYKTRIELRQIGVRDEAKRLGGIGSCGRKYCCTTFLQEFEPVTLRMARDQSLQVSPTKISGACGRLMCCLAYERDYYMNVAKQLPKVGARVETAYGEATVTGIDIFAQAVVVEDENGNEMRLTLDRIRKPGSEKKLVMDEEDSEETDRAGYDRYRDGEVEGKQDEG